MPAGYRRAAVAAVIFEDERSGRGPRTRHVLTIPPKGSTPGTDVTKIVGLKRYKKQVLVQFRRGDVHGGLAVALWSGTGCRSKSDM